MEIIIGFLIASAIGLTGVGGGVLTAPVLILFLGLPAPEAVSTSLAFVAIVKVLAVPVYLRRGQVNWGVLRCMLVGGVPGVLAGSLLLGRASSRGLNGFVLAAVGLTVAASASLSLVRLARRAEGTAGFERCARLALLSAGIGVEVGFSSAGAGALGTIALFHCTRLEAAEVVGTDLAFGLALSAIGGGLHFASGAVNSELLVKMALGGAAGALSGAHLASFVPTRLLRTAISLWLFWLGSQLCWRGLGALARAG